MDFEKNCLFVKKDYEGFETVFTKEQRNSKDQSRSELRDPDFLEGRLRDCICNPHFVYADYEHPKTRRAYYLKESFVVNGKQRYTKVVVDVSQSPRFVVSAYRPNHVKERNKTELLYGNDN